MIFESFNDMLSELKIVDKFDPEDLARKASAYLPKGKGISQENMRSYMRGASTPNRSRVNALLRALNYEDTYDPFDTVSPSAHVESAIVRLPNVYAPRECRFTTSYPDDFGVSILAKHIPREWLPRKVDANDPFYDVRCGASARPPVFEQEKRYTALTALYAEADARNIPRDNLLDGTRAGVEIAQPAYKGAEPRLKSVTLNVDALRHSFEVIANGR